MVYIIYLFIYLFINYNLFMAKTVQQVFNIGEGDCREDINWRKLMRRSIYVYRLSMWIINNDIKRSSFNYTIYNNRTMAPLMRIVT